MKKLLLAIMLFALMFTSCRKDNNKGHCGIVVGVSKHYQIGLVLDYVIIEVKYSDGSDSGGIQISARDWYNHPYSEGQDYCN